jgi:hypothetical protein
MRGGVIDAWRCKATGTKDACKTYLKLMVNILLTKLKENRIIFIVNRGADPENSDK